MRDVVHLRLEHKPAKKLVERESNRVRRRVKSSPHRALMIDSPKRCHPGSTKAPRHHKQLVWLPVDAGPSEQRGNSNNRQDTDELAQVGEFERDSRFSKRPSGEQDGEQIIHKGPAKVEDDSSHRLMK